MMCCRSVWLALALLVVSGRAEAVTERMPLSFRAMQWFEKRTRRIEPRHRHRLRGWLDVAFGLSRTPGHGPWMRGVYQDPVEREVGRLDLQNRWLGVDLAARGLVELMGGPGMMTQYAQTLRQTVGADRRICLPSASRTAVMGPDRAEQRGIQAMMRRLDQLQGWLARQTGVDGRPSHPPPVDEHGVLPSAQLIALIGVAHAAPYGAPRDQLISKVILAACRRHRPLRLDELALFLRVSVQQDAPTSATGKPDARDRALRLWSSHAAPTMGSVDQALAGLSVLLATGRLGGQTSAGMVRPNELLTALAPIDPQDAVLHRLGGVLAIIGLHHTAPHGPVLGRGP